MLHDAVRQLCSLVQANRLVQIALFVRTARLKKLTLFWPIWPNLPNNSIVDKANIAAQRCETRFDNGSR